MHLAATLFAVFFLWFAILVAGVPTWEGLNGGSSIGSLVPGASYIEALAPVKDNERQTHHLALDSPGHPGKLTILPNTKAPPLFYINRNKLWQFNNETSIFHVNVLNETQSDGYPLQLVVGKKQTGLTGGSWRWRGTMLYYDHGPAGNSGLYYSCRLADGSYGVFMFLRPSKTPIDCETITFHSWNRNYINGHK
ncbi:hypothetical protein Hypma_010204 [Hypsizygus marmoreus]|uniref:Cell wall protein RHD3 n=1 Tax=Hypsizygus marmoreus TaxID=39966 RepID=A0A369JLZ3_HYPMA|nr:hypothetical protein Hypma_010204 [Hypsizygus marmoreus]